MAVSCSIRRVSGPLEGFNPGRFGRMLVARGAFPSYAQKYAADPSVVGIIGPSTSGAVAASSKSA